jgi:hypothetical protein
MNSPQIANTIDVKQIANNYFQNNYYVANILLDKINYTKWNENRYKKNNKLISETKTVQPIILGDFDEKIHKYNLTDGNHRCYCCKELGYTYIPAIIPNYIEDESFIKITIF